MREDIKELISKMTIDEKISLACGQDFWKTRPIERLEIPSVMMCDGPHGLRKQKGVGDHLGLNESIETVCYPSASALASSFDIEVMEKLGEALGIECQFENVGMLLGPGVNIKRSPLCGRNFEYFSEDPYLSGQMAVAYIRSLQEKGIDACVKHFAANNQESMRMIGNSCLSERTLHETYLPAFEAAVKEGGTHSIMCAYNAVNGDFCSTNKELLTDVLREQWNFDGFVVTDWGAGKDAVQGLKAGLDLNMPGGHDAISAPLKAAFESGMISEKEIDRMTGRMLRFALDHRMSECSDAEFDRNIYAELSANLASQCAVLLKNEGILPLDKEKKVAFIGEFASSPRYQGSGSSHINCKKIISALDVAKKYSVTYAQGYIARTGRTDADLLKEAVNIAKEADIAVIYAGLPYNFESEGFDRDNLDMPENQNELISAVTDVNPNTVVVLHGGAPMLMEWIDKVKAVLCMYLGGQGVGKATVELLYGDVNPSGKLAETWPKKLADTPCYLNFPGVEGKVDYAEGVFIGYRYYDKKEMDVLFPFGHGLSYTNFIYTDILIDKNEMFDTDIVHITCTVKNTGNVVGKEVVQLYIRNADCNVPRPIRELRGFVKVELRPGEETQVSFSIGRRAFAYYEERLHDFYVESGLYGIEIGASSRDIRLYTYVYVNGTVEIPYKYSLASTIGSLQKTVGGRAVFQQFMAGMQQSEENRDSMDAMGEGGADMVRKSFLEMPLGALVSFGGISAEQLDDLIMMLNK